MRLHDPSARPGGEGIPAGLANHPDYVIRRELGRGGMGVVYLAHNRLMRRDEVLKVMGGWISDRPDVRDRFLGEILAVARLRHPNIVMAYNAFDCGGTVVLAMEYIEGRNLSQVVKAAGPLPVSHACYYAAQAALALQHAHAHNLVHRDIKPGNLMLSSQGKRPLVKVLDFGLAKLGFESLTIDPGRSGFPAESVRGRAITVMGQVLGTLEFIAPEQIADSQKADLRADIYSLGCTLYYLLKGSPPFDQRDPGELIRAHEETEARSLNLVRRDVPPELSAIVARMMAKDPARRFQSAAAVAQATRAILHEEPGQGSSRKERDGRRRGKE